MMETINAFTGEKMTEALPDPVLRRYRRQIRLPMIGTDGQEKLAGASILLVGAGATGSMLAELMVRAGVGEITVVDRDFVEMHDLHRQFAYTERDLGEPKAQRLADRLREINSGVRLSFHVGELDHRNVRTYIESSRADMIMDATDNIYSRQVLNEACFRRGISWVYCGATGTTAMAAAFPFHYPGRAHGGEEYTADREGPCFRCLVPGLPPPGSIPTCETLGILNTAAAAAASMAATQGFKLLLTGTSDGLLVWDIWASEFQRMDIPRRPDCMCCARREFEFLDGKYAPASIKLCGEGAFQINLPGELSGEDFNCLKERLSRIGDREDFKTSRWHIRFSDEGVELVIFRDGRVVVRGVGSPEAARAHYDRFVGL